MDSSLGLIDIERSFNYRYSALVREALDVLPDNFTITDPSISGHPIVFASSGFLKMCGYSREEVIGRNGGMFQGPWTNCQSVMEIREAIRHERDVQVNLLNYRKDGTPFWMLFHMRPVFGKEDGRVTHFVAVQVPILRRPRRSTSGIRRNGAGFCNDRCPTRELAFGSCRREMCSDSAVDFDHVLAMESTLDSDSRGLGIEEHCEAGDLERRQAASALNNIFSVLTRYSELTGRLICEKRCTSSVMSRLSSSITLSLGRIKQSFVLTDPHLPDMPIVYASDAFFRLTGYSRHEVLGQNCRFLSGVDTNRSTLSLLKERIQAEKSCTEG